MNDDEANGNDESVDDEAASEARRERQFDARVRRQHRHLEPIDPDDQAFFGGYCGAKAETLLEKGVEQYRGEDSFAMPSDKFDADQLAGVLVGCEQLAAGRGFTMETPMQGNSVGGCYALIATLHFKVIGRQTHRPGRGFIDEQGKRIRNRPFLDEVRCQHRVSGFVGSLFNQVVYSRDD